MFKFFKDKIKGAISKLSKKVDEEGKEEVIEKTVEKPVDKKETRDKELPVKKESKIEEKPKKREPSKVSDHETVKEATKKVVSRERPKVAKPEKKVVDTPAVKTEETLEKNIERQPAKVKKEIEGPAKKTGEEVTHANKPREKKGFFKRFTEKITTKKVSDTLFEEIFWELEMVLLENNVALKVIEKIKQDLKKELVDKPVARSKVQETIINTLKQSIGELFIVSKIDLLSRANDKKPLVVCMVGINGSGKTTTIAKLAKFFEDNGKSVVLAAADTFRAAAIDQLQIHADNLGVKLIKHDYGADAAAVAFDAISHATSKGKDVVLIDTAGRLHSNHNLVDEMKKIVRVAKPDINIFVGESITGNDCVEQAVKFDEAIGLDGIILSKADIDEKGGAAISVSYVTGKPILYLGVGQEYGDLVPFDPSDMVNKLFA